MSNVLTLNGPEGISEAINFVTRSRRPQMNKAGLVTNSFLDKREWSALDDAIIRMVKLRQVGVADLRARNLWKTTTLAEMLSQWRVASEKVAPSVNMNGSSQANKDRVDKKTYGVPIPILRSDYSIGRRELLASRSLGSPIDTMEAEEAAEAVSEKLENILFNGYTGIVVQGNYIYGYTTLPARDTATAAAYGGGDFGTISNIFPTFSGMLTALSAKRYHGPFGCYVANTQYNQMLAVYTDGSGQSALQRVLTIPEIEFIKPSDQLSDGVTVMVQMTGNVVSMIEALALDNREWESGDGMELYFAVLMAGAPKLITDYAGYAGIAHATGC
jgi:uncharacterized linocin/CFP29 family protein